MRKVPFLILSLILVIGLAIPINTPVAAQTQALDTITVPSNNSIVQSDIILENGKTYLFKAVGTYVYWDYYEIDETFESDAEYALRPEGDWRKDWYGTNYNLDVLVDDNDVDWGVYNSEHIYSYLYTGKGAKASFRIMDNYTGDNSGSITVEIYPLVVQSFDASRSWDYEYGPEGAKTVDVGFGSFVKGNEFTLARSLLSAEGYSFGDGISTITPASLAGVDIFVVSPLKTELSPEEITLLEAFVLHGGAVLVVTNWPATILGVDDTGIFSGCDKTVFTNESDTNVAEIANGVGLPISVGAHSDIRSSASGVPFLVDNDGSGRFCGVVLPPATGRTGRAVIIGDEEIFSSNFNETYGGGSSHLYYSDYNKQLLLNVFNYLSQAPGLEQSGLLALQTIAKVTDIQSSIDNSDIPIGTQTSLTSKLQAVIDSLNLGLQIQAKNQLNAFINQVNAQRNKKITNEQADILIAAARDIFQGD
jgi:hypothetical protein